MTRKTASPERRVPRKIPELIKTSPSPPLAENNLQRLLELTPQDLAKIPAEKLPVLVQLLGASSFLADVLLREGVEWPDVFLQQISFEQKTRAAHARELDTLVRNSDSLDQFCAGLRRHKQREHGE